MSLLQLLLFTATAGSAAALVPKTRRRVARRTRDSAAKPPPRHRSVISAATPLRRRRVTCRVLDDAIDDLEALGDLGALDDAASLDLDALVAGAGLTVASTAAASERGRRSCVCIPLPSTSSCSRPIFSAMSADRMSDAAPPCYLAEPHHAALRQRELASHVT